MNAWNFHHHHHTVIYHPEGRWTGPLDRWPCNRAWPADGSTGSTGLTGWTGLDHDTVFFAPGGDLEQQVACLFLPPWALCRNVSSLPLLVCLLPTRTELETHKLRKPSDCHAILIVFVLVPKNLKGSPQSPPRKSKFLVPARVYLQDMDPVRYHVFRTCSLVTGLYLPGNRNLGNGDFLWRKPPMCLHTTYFSTFCVSFFGHDEQNRGIYYICTTYIIYQILYAIHRKSSVLAIVHISHLSIHILTYLNTIID